jgi:hypothetical protein
MNGRSGVQRSGLPADQEPAIDWDAETHNLVAKIVANMTQANVAENGTICELRRGFVSLNESQLKDICGLSTSTAIVLGKF